MDNRFFNNEHRADNSSTKELFSSQKILARINANIEKVQTLCQVKGHQGAPSQALSALSFLHKNIMAIVKNAPEDAQQHHSVIASKP